MNSKRETKSEVKKHSATRVDDVCTKSWENLINLGLRVSEHSIVSKSFNDKKTNLKKTLDLFEAKAFNCEGKKFLIQVWGASAQKAAQAFLRSQEYDVLMMFPQTLNSTESKPTPAFEFHIMEPNFYQIEAGVKKVIALRNTHLPFVSGALPRPFLWSEQTYELNGNLLPHPSEWLNLVDADEVVDQEFVSFDEASPKKQKI